MTTTAVIMTAILTTTAATAPPLPHAVSGKGPAVVLMHGMGGDRHVWDAVAARL